jgi:RimJ/RimL family protein N-acetyltransferase
MVTLETPRLTLRPITLDDTDALLAVWGDPVAMRWYPAPLNREEMAHRILQQMERYQSGTGQLGIVVKESGALIGNCGPVWHDVMGVQELEIGYSVRRDHWGKGYASEAALAALAYVRDSLHKSNPISLIRTGNLPSRRVAEKNGAHLEKTVFWRDYDHCVYRYQLLN